MVVGAEKHITVKSKIPENDFLSFWKIIIESQKEKKTINLDLIFWFDVECHWRYFLAFCFGISGESLYSFVLKCILKACLFSKNIKLLFFIVYFFYFNGIMLKIKKYFLKIHLLQYQKYILKSWSIDVHLMTLETWIFCSVGIILYFR